jgi:cyclophilin family peptidyl-prolyl cis-trans isomerase
MNAAAPDNPRVALDIAQGDESLGRIVLELDAERTPATTENFLTYVDSGFFAGTVFHRVIPNFMIQGGGYDPELQAKREGVQAPVRNEAESGRSNTRGTIAMARTNDPHSATCEFFINVADNDFLNHPGQDGWGYCAFGRVVEGMDVVDRIRNIDTQFNPAMGEESQPTVPPVIQSCARV